MLISLTDIPLGHAPLAETVERGQPPPQQHQMGVGQLERAVLLIARAPWHSQLPCQLHSRQLSSSSSWCCSSPPTTAAAPKACKIYEDDQVPISAQDLPLPVWRTMQTLRAAGHTVLLVGGAVRDLLLGCPPKDFDLLTSAQMSQLRQLLPHARVFGRTFPICQLTSEGTRLEISSMHTRAPIQLSSAGSSSRAVVPPDAAQVLLAGPKAAAAAAAATAAAASGQIGRHRRGVTAAPQRQQPPWPQQQQQQPQPPQQQQLSWAAARRHNAACRDFTVNSLLYDPFAGVLFDYVGGMQDAAARALRCNGDPAERFSRDPACMLRAVRCAARAGLTIEASTVSALLQHSSMVSSLNSHRLTAELMAMLAYGAAAPSLQLLKQMQLLQQVLPLHAAYLQRHQHVSQQLKHMLLDQQEQQQLACKSSSQQCTADDQTRQQARQGVLCGKGFSAQSALGQLWCGGSVPLHHPQQQHQQQRQQQQQQGQRSGHSNLLMQVLSALDQHAGVSQPAQQEVVVACLAAPLLVEVLEQAVVQLEQRQQQQQQQRHMQRHMQQRQQMQIQLQQQMQLEQQQAQQQSLASLLEVQLLQNPLPEGHPDKAARAAAVLLTSVLQSWAAARNVARPFSSSSSNSGSNGSSGSSSRQVKSAQQQQQQQAVALSSEAVGVLARELVQQLQQGVSVADCIVQHAKEIARQQLLYSSPPASEGAEGAEAAADQQQWMGQQLFGVHVVDAATDLLLSRMHDSNSSSMQQSQLEQAGRGAANSIQQGNSPQQQQQQVSAFNSQRGSSRQGRGQHKHSSSVGAGLDLWDEYATRLPRSNKQYRQLMQQQWEQQLQGARAGSIGVLQQDAWLLAAAKADQAAAYRQGGYSPLAAVLPAADVSGQPWEQPRGPSAAQLFQQVLQTAGLDLRVYQQRLQELQRGVLTYQGTSGMH